MKYISCLAVLFLALSCNTVEYYYSEAKSVSGDAWSYSDALSYTFTIEDNAQPYDLVLEIDHSPDYSFQNLYINIETTFPDGKVTTDLVPIQMAEKSGKWFGKCGSTNCTLPISLQENIKFENAGEHSIRISQNTREANLKGIRTLTLSILERPAANS